MLTFSGSSAKLRQVNHLANENERETAQIGAVRRELFAWASRQTDRGLRLSAHRIREALLHAHTPELRARLMEYVTKFGERVASLKNS